jgi:hypothetical protein
MYTSDYPGGQSSVERENRASSVTKLNTVTVTEEDFYHRATSLPRPEGHERAMHTHRPRGWFEFVQETFISNCIYSENSSLSPQFNASEVVYFSRREKGEGEKSRMEEKILSINLFYRVVLLESMTSSIADKLPDFLQNRGFIVRPRSRTFSNNSVPIHHRVRLPPDGSCRRRLASPPSTSRIRRRFSTNCPR